MQWSNCPTLACRDHRISTDACSVQTAYAKVQLRRWWSFSSFQLTAASYEVWCGLDRVNPYFAVLFDGLNVLCRRDDAARLIQSTRVRTNDRCLSRQPTTLPCNEDWCQQVWIAEDPSCKRPRCLQGFSKNSLYVRHDHDLHCVLVPKSMLLTL